MFLNKVAMLFKLQYAGLESLGLLPTDVTVASQIRRHHKSLACHLFSSQPVVDRRTGVFTLTARTLVFEPGVPRLPPSLLHVYLFKNSVDSLS